MPENRNGKIRHKYRNVNLTYEDVEGVWQPLQMEAPFDGITIYYLVTDDNKIVIRGQINDQDKWKSTFFHDENTTNGFGEVTGTKTAPNDSPNFVLFNLPDKYKNLRLDADSVTFISNNRYNDTTTIGVSGSSVLITRVDAFSYQHSPIWLSGIILDYDE